MKTYINVVIGKDQQQYHQAILKALGQMDVGDQLGLVVREAQPAQGDLEGVTLEVVKVRNDAFVAYSSNQYVDGELFLGNEEMVLEMYEGLACEVEAAKDALEETAYDPYS